MNGEEHDQLIILTTKIEQLCIDSERNNKENKEEHKSIMTKIDRNYHRVENNMKDKVDFKVFKWVAGCISTVLLLSILTIGGISLANKSALYELNDLIVDHIAFSTYIYKEVTGEEWGHASREAIVKARKQFETVREAAKEKE